MGERTLPNFSLPCRQEQNACSDTDIGISYTFPTTRTTCIRCSHERPDTQGHMRTPEINRTQPATINHQTNQHRHPAESRIVTIQLSKHREPRLVEIDWGEKIQVFLTDIPTIGTREYDSAGCCCLHVRIERSHAAHHGMGLLTACYDL